MFKIENETTTIKALVSIRENTKSSAALYSNPEFLKNGSLVKISKCVESELIAIEFAYESDSTLRTAKQHQKIIDAFGPNYLVLHEYKLIYMRSGKIHQHTEFWESKTPADVIDIINEIEVPFSFDKVFEIIRNKCAAEFKRTHNGVSDCVALPIKGSE